VNKSEGQTAQKPARASLPSWEQIQAIQKDFSCFFAHYTGDGESNVADRVRALLETLGRLSRQLARNPPDVKPNARSSSHFMLRLRFILCAIDQKPQNYRGGLS